MVALIAWLLILGEGRSALQYLWRLWPLPSPQWLPQDIYLLLSVAGCLCGIALLKRTWWARRATVAVLVISILYRVASYLGLNALLMHGNLANLHFALSEILQSLLSALLLSGKDLVMLYFLTLPAIAADWPRQPDAPPLTEARLPVLHRALQRCSQAVSRLLPPVLPAEVAYIALAMLFDAAVSIEIIIAQLVRSTPHNRSPQIPFISVVFIEDVILLVLVFALLRLTSWALFGTIIMKCGLFVIQQLRMVAGVFAPAAIRHLYPKVTLSGMLLNLCWLLISLLMLGLQVYLLTRPRVMQLFGWAPETTDAPVVEVLGDSPGG